MGRGVAGGVTPGHRGGGSRPPISTFSADAGAAGQVQSSRAGRASRPVGILSDRASMVRKCIPMAASVVVLALAGLGVRYANRPKVEMPSSYPVNVAEAQPDERGVAGPAPAAESPEQ